MGQLGGPGSYFATSAEADEWLDFEADSVERERKFFTESDRYAEWEQWWERWLDQNY